MHIRFTVCGEPVGKARPRYSPRNGRMYTPSKTEKAERNIKSVYHEQCNGLKIRRGTPVAIRIDAWYKIPQSASKKVRQKMVDGEIRPLKKPDIDNVTKLVLDALNGLAYDDDAQIVLCETIKHYAENPRVTVQIDAIENDGGESE